MFRYASFARLASRRSPQVRCMMAESSSSNVSVIKAYAKQPRLLEEIASFKPAEGFLVDLQLCDAANHNSNGSSPSFNPQPFLSTLTTQTMGQLLLTAATIDSTQTFLRAHSRALPEGTVFVADQQTQGKGRGGNTWTSPTGCLMFSVGRRLAVLGSQAPFINYVVCLAVLQGIAAAAEHVLKGQAPNVQVKWPNDIYSGGVKIGGALIHTTWQSDAFRVITGIGLNVSNTHPTTCLNSVLSQQLQQQPHSTDSTAAMGSAPTGTAAAAEVPAGESSISNPAGAPEQAVHICHEELLGHICNALERCFTTFERQGFAALEQEYLRCWMHSGQQVLLVDRPGDADDAGQPVSLTITGLSSTGFLRAVDAAGVAYELTPDGNSLDMMQGLIRRKIM